MALDPDVQALIDKTAADFAAYNDDLSGQIADLKTQVASGASKADIMAAIQGLDDTVNAAKAAADATPEPPPAP